MGAPVKVVVVDDDEAIADALKQHLERDGLFEVTVLTKAGDAVEEIRKIKPQVAVLDVEMHDDGLAGFGLADQLNKIPEFSGDNLHVIYITGVEKNYEIGGQITATSLGGKHFLFKGPTLQELLKSKIEVLVHDSAVEGEIFSDGRIVINEEFKTVVRDGQAFKFTARQVEIIRYLISQPGKLVNTSDLMEEFFDLEAQESALTKEMSTIRNIISDDAEVNYIRSVYGKGYVFERPEDSPVRPKKKSKIRRKSKEK